MISRLITWIVGFGTLVVSGIAAQPKPPGDSVTVVPFAGFEASGLRRFFRNKHPSVRHGPLGCARERSVRATDNSRSVRYAKGESGLQWLWPASTDSRLPSGHQHATVWHYSDRP